MLCAQNKIQRHSSTFFFTLRLRRNIFMLLKCYYILRWWWVELYATISWWIPYIFFKFNALHKKHLSLFSLDLFLHENQLQFRMLRNKFLGRHHAIQFTFVNSTNFTDSLIDFDTCDVVCIMPKIFLLNFTQTNIRVKRLCINFTHSFY